ncbi:4Fe-4S dicluster domain-containing protein [Bengtsoniella intestinalis]|uniref:4Fe-4S dicluster domain-containing protein n=1 Tax=Bengtsoniella intestinalis TaxID=3073143 RepID=UPI00391F6631
MTAKLTFDTERCKGCELCTAVCPKHIVIMEPVLVNAKGYHPATVTDISACIACGSCGKICPDSVITVENSHEGERHEKGTLERQ